MQYNAKTPEQYIQMLDDDWRREKIDILRALLKSRVPNVTESINYKMLSYSDERGIIFHLNAQKSYVSLYVGDIKKIDPEGKLLKGIDTGKGCVRFKKSVDIADTGIDKFIVRAVNLWRSGVDIGC